MKAVVSREPFELVRATPGLAGYLAAVESRLGELLASADGPAGKAGGSALKSGGKRLRPLLTFLCALGERTPPVGAGVAIELVHLASLVHDDLLDGAELRRGAPSIWSAYGEGVALASGDCLFALAFSELAREAGPEALTALAEAALALSEGEALQQEQQGDVSLTVDVMLDRCARKTGALFSAACRLGAGDGRLGDYGLALGIAFQIVDDILDCSGDLRETGKSPGADLAAGVVTLPLLLAAESDPQAREAIGEALAGDGERRLAALVRVAASGALERSREIARSFAREACSHIEGHPRAQELEALAVAISERAR